MRPSARAHLRGLRGTLLALLASAALCARVAADEPLRVGIVVHTVVREGSPVAAPAFIAEQLARANEIYRPLGLELVEQTGKPLPSRHAEVVTRAQRDAFARHVRPGAIDCFVVAKLMDVDEPGRERRGVHWRARDRAGIRYIVLSQIAGPYVLAHELGHYFGNPQHSVVPGNLMSYTRAEGAPVLDAEQTARVATALKQMLASGELRPLSASFIAP